MINLFAQSRENKIILNFKDKSEKLSEATGWAENKNTGKWIENKKVIDENECPSYWISHTFQNFNWIQFTIINKNNIDYYVLLYEHFSGEYDYPNIEEDWKEFKQSLFMILTLKQYSEIKKQVDLKSGSNIKITSNMTGQINSRFNILGGEHLYNEENLLAKITNVIENPSRYSNCFIFNSQIINGIEVVRFRLPDSSNSIDDDMKTAYFEVNLSEFKKILTK